MSKRGGGKSHENKRHEQLSLFDILLENDDQGFSCAAPAGEEQATLYNFEDESEIRHKIGATDRRSESALQSGFEGDNVTRTNREFTSSEIRSEERRVGKECRIGCRSRWSPYH